MHLDAVDPRPIRVALHKLRDALPGTGYLWNSKVLRDNSIHKDSYILNSEGKFSLQTTAGTRLQTAPDKRHNRLLLPLTINRM